MRIADFGPFSTKVIAAVLIVSGSCVAVMQTLIIPLLPDLPKILNVDHDAVSWLVTATLLSSAIGTPSLTRLADMYGKKRMLMVALFAMFAGSFVGSIAHSIGILVVARVLQGFSMSLIPIGISIMRDEIPREHLAKSVAYMSSTLGLGAVLGLPLAGFMYEHYGWNSVFLISATFAAIMLALVAVVVPESSVMSGGRFDAMGALLISIALGTALLVITESAKWRLMSLKTLVGVVIVAIIVPLWIRLENRQSAPLIDLQTFRYRPVLLTNITSMLVGFAMYANMLTTTQQLQLPISHEVGFGLDAQKAGLCLIPAGLMMIVFSPVAARVTKASGPRRTLIIGAVILMTGYIFRIFMMNSVAEIILGGVIVTSGTAMSYAAMPTLIMRSVPVSETAGANGVNTVLRTVGTSFCSATLAAFMTHFIVDVGGVSLPTRSAFVAIFVLAASAALAAALVAMKLPSSHAFD